jgi:hypothetical protein
MKHHGPGPGPLQLPLILGNRPLKDRIERSLVARQCETSIQALGMSENKIRTRAMR